jgi:hypothetical protein
MARDFEAALRRVGKPVEAMYYEGAGHNGIFTSSTQRDDEVQRIVGVPPAPSSQLTITIYGLLDRRQACAFGGTRQGRAE